MWLYHIMYVVQNRRKHVQNQFKNTKKMANITLIWPIIAKNDAVVF